MKCIFRTCYNFADTDHLQFVIGTQLQMFFFVGVRVYRAKMPLRDQIATHIAAETLLCHSAGGAASHPFLHHLSGIIYTIHQITHSSITNPDFGPVVLLKMLL